MASLGELLGEYLFGMPQDAEVVEGTRGNVLPGAKYRLPDGTERWGVAAPQGLADALLGLGAAGGRVQDPNAPQGYVSQEALRRGGEGLAGSATLGSFATPKPANALTMGLKAYHGSPHRFDKFSMDKIGTGEGAQVYGHGLYFAENPNVARSYRDTLSRGTKPQYRPSQNNDVSAWWKEAEELFPDDPSSQGLFHYLNQMGNKESALKYFDDMASSPYVEIKDGKWEYAPGKSFSREELVAAADEMYNPGALYRVDIDAEPNQFLDWDKPLSEQPDAVRSAYMKAFLGSSDDPDTALLAELLTDTSPEAMTAMGMVPTAKGSAAYKTLAERTGALDWDVNADAAGRQAVRSQAERAASERLKNSGLRGIRYLDQGSRKAGEGSSNYVVFDDDIITIEDILAAQGRNSQAAGLAMELARNQGREAPQIRYNPEGFAPPPGSRNIDIDDGGGRGSIRATSGRGYVYGKDGSDPMIKESFVDPEYRGTGSGADLYRAWAQYAAGPFRSDKQVSSAARQMYEGMLPREGYNVLRNPTAYEHPSGTTLTQDGRHAYRVEPPGMNSTEFYTNPLAGAVPLTMPAPGPQGPTLGEVQGRPIPPEEEAQRQALIRYLEGGM